MTFIRPLIFAFLFSLFNNISFSQDVERCGTDVLFEQQMQDPKFSRSFFKLEKEIEKMRSVTTKSSNTPITVPVIVHIIHEGEPYGTGNHFTTEYVEETIDNLNQNFAGEFTSDPTANTEISFCIANNSTTGEPIDGIRYYNWNDLYSYDINTFDDGGTNNINLANLIGYDRPNYCNIYVLDWGGGPLGFAYIPPSDYGVYMRSSYFGLTGGNYGQNRTLVHEAGHYCGLFHTFQSTSSCGPETNCNAQGDRVCDTPPTTGNWACPTNGGACGNDLVNNYMDYTYDTCMDSFTEGQKTRMISSLETSRPGVVNNTLACGASGGIEVGVVGINIPTEGCLTSLDGATFEFQNFGDTVTDVVFNYIINDNSGTIPWNGTLGFGETITINLPTTEIPFGITYVEVEVIISDDIYLDNNITSYEFDNFEGVTIDIEIDFDALPAGLDWNLYESVDGVPVGEPLFEAEYFTVGFNDLYSCGNESYSFCLPEGEYVIVMTDLFGNGMNYPFCNGDYTSGDFTILNGNDTLNYVIGGWDESIDLPFIVEEGCPPLSDCPWDINGDHIVNAPDVLILLQNFGLYDECTPLDLDQDGVIGVGDILDFISYFGYNCITGEFQISDGGELLRSLMDQYGIEIEENPIESVEYYTIHGAKLNFNDITSSGIYIVKTKYADGSYEVKKVIK